MRRAVVRGVFLLFALTAAVGAATPPPLIADIPWDEDPGKAGPRETYSGICAVEAAFNHARRQEERQLGLPAGQLGTLRMPGQKKWDALEPGLKALYLVNAERTARREMQPGVSGLPLGGIDENVSRAAQAYADLLVEKNAVGHSAGGKNSFERLREDSILGTCHEWTCRTEAVANFFSSTGSNPLPVERAIYGWLFEDSGGKWGHRELLLLQERDKGGITNNFGDPADEGFIGVGVADSATYNPDHLDWVKRGTAVVFQLVDPKPSGSYAWDRTKRLPADLVAP